ncbi:hypothetical protein [Neorhizobium lilium]|uniref:hypothetical protein n=1 Tax=Neorhizobium lilium TaxID=2503024 RepID=UPI001FDFCA4E|nr:hypothetical protein [Neorhizobium lilium]
MASEALEQTIEEAVDRMQELTSLARLVTYARDSAKGLEIEFSAYCLDLTLGSLVEELAKCGMSDLGGTDHENQSPSFISGVSH